MHRATGVLERGQTIPCSAWYGTQTREGLCIAFTTVEPGPAISRSESSILVSRDAFHWEEACCFRKDAYRPMRVFKYGVISCPSGEMSASDFWISGEGLVGLDGCTKRLCISENASVLKNFCAAVLNSAAGLFDEATSYGTLHSWCRGACDDIFSRFALTEHDLDGDVAADAAVAFRLAQDQFPGHFPGTRFEPLAIPAMEDRHGDFENARVWLKHVMAGRSGISRASPRTMGISSRPAWLFAENYPVRSKNKSCGTSRSSASACLAIGTGLLDRLNATANGRRSPFSFFTWRRRIAICEC